MNEHIAINKIDSNEVVKIRMDALELKNHLKSLDNKVAGAKFKYKNNPMDNPKAAKDIQMLCMGIHLTLIQHV